MDIQTNIIKLGKHPELGWYVKANNVTCWCNSLSEAINHIAF